MLASLISTYQSYGPKFKLLVPAVLIATLGLATAFDYLRTDIRYGLSAHAAGSDYVNIVLGSTLIQTGHGSANELYNLDLQRTLQQSITAAYGPIHFPDNLLPFISPPFVAIMHAPFYSLPIGTSFLLWDVIQLIALIISLLLLTALVPTSERLLLWLAAVAYMPTQQIFDQGQISCLLLLGVVLLWRGLRAGGAGEWWAGIGLGLLLLKPQLLPLFILYLLYHRKWRALYGFGLMAVAWYLISALVSGFDWPRYYLDIANWVGNQHNHYSVYPSGMFSWRALLVGFGLDSSLLVALVSLLTAFALLYTWWRSKSLNTPNGLPVSSLELQLAGVNIAALLDSFYLNNQDLVVLIFSGAVLMGWSRQHGWPLWVAALLGLGLFAPALVGNGWPMNLPQITLMIVGLAVVSYITITRPLHSDVPI